MSVEPAPEELRVASAAEIAAYLQDMLRERAAVRMNSPTGHSLVTHICALNASADLLGLELGADPEGISEALVASGEITAVAFLGAIKLQFELEAPVLVSGEQGTVLRSQMPQRLYRFQRRQAYRVQPPGSLFPRVVLPGPSPDQPGRALRVLDISIGGVALALPADLDPLPLGHVSEGLSLELDRLTALWVDLLAHHVSPIAEAAADTRQLGCAFVELPAEAARTLQVYVDQTQKRRRLLRMEP